MPMNSMSFRCDRHNRNFQSKEELDDHRVKTHELIKDTNADNIKTALHKTAKSKSKIIGTTRKNLKFIHNLENS